MSNRNLSDIAGILIAAIRTAYGDFSALGFQAVKHLPMILTLLFAILFVVIIVPVIFINSLFFGYNIPTSGQASDFSDIVLQCIQYKEDWLKVYAVTQSKRLFSNTGVDIEAAADAVKKGTVESYLAGDKNTKDRKALMKIHNGNLELLENTIGGFAGYVYHYDEFPISMDFYNIRKTYDPYLQQYNLVADLWAGEKSVEVILYSQNDVVNFKTIVETTPGGESPVKTLKFKYRRFELSAYFPVHGDSPCSFTDDFGTDRINNGVRQGHEGIDIFSTRNTPLIAIEDCTIKQKGWNGLGGWRLLMTSSDGKRTYYYAHLERYADHLTGYVKAGQVVGYVGSSGGFYDSSPPGTDTGTLPHLHLQFWVQNGSWFRKKNVLFNPYPFLKLLEKNKYSYVQEEIDRKLREEGL